MTFSARTRRRILHFLGTVLLVSSSASAVVTGFSSVAVVSGRSSPHGGRRCQNIIFQQVVFIDHVFIFQGDCDFLERHSSSTRCRLALGCQDPTSICRPPFRGRGQTCQQKRRMDGLQVLAFSDDLNRDARFRIQYRHPVCQFHRVKHICLGEISRRDYQQESIDRGRSHVLTSRSYVGGVRGSHDFRKGGSITAGSTSNMKANRESIICTTSHCNENDGLFNI
mmetsp:Transcript_6002/g.17133  ORF Transcript_6002/g.17133 Transcript_6002/m.17133 type:complete len:224 (+) Transcript_6002:211-882(+)